MADIKMSVSTPRVEQEQLPQLTASEKIPSNWIITPAGDDIAAYHIVTNKQFAGTIEQFNEMLKGK
jgi:hypothetical protein